MTHLIKIGNSQGIRIPKPIIKQAHLEDADLALKITNDGLLITPSKKTARSHWQLAIDKEIAKHGNESIDKEWLDSSLTNDEDLQW